MLLIKGIEPRILVECRAESLPQARQAEAMQSRFHMSLEEAVSW